MVSRAVGKYSKVSPYKARLVANMIKGKDVEWAISALTFSPKKAAGLISKILKSAVANAEHESAGSAGELFVKVAKVDAGPIIKRFDPRAMGRAVRIRQRTSHITIELAVK